MQLNDATEQYIGILADLLLPYNFKKKGKNLVVRNVGNCLQQVRIMVTKLRGTDSIDIRYVVSYSYPTINKIASYIQGIPYRKKLSTGVFHAVYDAPCKIAYSHVISELMSEQDVTNFANLDAHAIVTHFFPLLEKCDTPEKLISALRNADINVTKSIVGLGLNEWIQISALLYLGKVEEAIQLFDKWTPLAWFGRQMLSDAEKRLCRWRIATYEAGTVPIDNYILFGRQGDGSYIPIPPI